MAGEHSNDATETADKEAFTAEQSTRSKGGRVTR